MTIQHITRLGEGASRSEWAAAYNRLCMEVERLANMTAVQPLALVRDNTGYHFRWEDNTGFYAQITGQVGSSNEYTFEAVTGDGNAGWSFTSGYVANGSPIVASEDNGNTAVAVGTVVWVRTAINEDVWNFAYPAPDFTGPVTFESTVTFTPTSTTTFQSGSTLIFAGPTWNMTSNTLLTVSASTIFSITGATGSSLAISIPTLTLSSTTINVSGALRIGGGFWWEEVTYLINFSSVANWNPTGRKVVFRLNVTTPCSLYSMVANNTTAPYVEVYEFWNVGSQPLVIVNNSSGHSEAAGTLFFTSTGGNITILPADFALVRYDPVLGQWWVTQTTETDLLACRTYAGAALTGHQVIVSLPGSGLAELGAMTNGQLVIGSTGAAPAIATLTAGRNIGGTNAAGAITLNSDFAHQTFNNTAYTITGTADAVVHQVGTMSAARVVTLPAANGKPAQVIFLIDLSGTVTEADNLAVTPAGTDEINGAGTPFLLIEGFGGVLLTSDGVSNWTASCLPPECCCGQDFSYFHSANANLVLTGPKDQIASNTATLTADRTTTLPPASSRAAQVVIVRDQSGNLASHNLFIAPAGSDTINGSSSAQAITIAYDSRIFTSNGVSGWFVAPPVSTGTVSLTATQIAYGDPSNVLTSGPDLTYTPSTSPPALSVAQQINIRPPAGSADNSPGDVTAVLQYFVQYLGSPAALWNVKSIFTSVSGGTAYGDLVSYDAFGNEIFRLVGLGVVRLAQYVSAPLLGTDGSGNIVAVTSGLTGTYNFDATTSGNITSMTFANGILTGVTTHP